MYCGGAAVEVPDTRLLACPACERTMQKVDDDGVVIDQCTACGGRFYDAGELDEALAAARRNEAPATIEETTTGLRQRTGTYEVTDAVRVRRCPVCQQGMTRKNFARLSGIILDVCSHGVFLDPGEWEQVSDFVRRGGERLGVRQRAVDEARDARARQVHRRNDEGFRVAMALGDTLVDEGW